MTKLKKLICYINMNGKLLGALLAAGGVILAVASAALLIWAANAGWFFPVAVVLFTVYITVFAILMDRKRS